MTVQKWGGLASFLLPAGFREVDTRRWGQTQVVFARYQTH